jgi:hypothetical protein
MMQLPEVALEVVEKLGPMVVAKLKHPWQAGQPETLRQAVIALGVAVEVVERLGPMVVAKLQHPQRLLELQPDRQQMTLRWI